MRDKFEPFKELLKALREIKYAILGNNNNGGEGDNENYTWYDFIRDNIIKPFDDYLESIGVEDINPVPVAIADIHSDNLNFRLLKDIPISQPIANSGFLLYDTIFRLGSVGSGHVIYGGSPILPRFTPYLLSFECAEHYYSIMEIEIDGKTYYYTEYPGD